MLRRARSARSGPTRAVEVAGAITDPSGDAVHGMWTLEGTTGPKSKGFSWRLDYGPISLADGMVLSIDITTTRPPKVRNRAHAFRILDDYRRANALPWLEEVRVDGDWCKCVLNIETLAAFIRPLLDGGHIWLCCSREQTSGSTPTIFSTTC